MKSFLYSQLLPSSRCKFFTVFSNQTQEEEEKKEKHVKYEYSFNISPGRCCCCCKNTTRSGVVFIDYYRQLTDLTIKHIITITCL